MDGYNTINRKIAKIFAVPVLCVALSGCPTPHTPTPDSKIVVSGLEGRLNDNKVDVWDSNYRLGNVDISVSDGSLDSITWAQGLASGYGSYNNSSKEITLSGNPGYGLLSINVYGVNIEGKQSSMTLDGIMVGPNGSSDFYDDGTKFNTDFGGMGNVSYGRHAVVGTDITSSDIETMLSSLPFKDYVKGCVEMSYGLNAAKYIVFSKNEKSGLFNYTVFETDETKNDEIYNADPINSMP
jgi:hypothetical protein